MPGIVDSQSIASVHLGDYRLAALRLRLDRVMEPFPRQGASRQTAVLALTLCVMALIASEFLPVSLLTPIASDLLVSEGRAGQAIAISGVFAVVTSLFISVWTARIDRRDVLLSLTVAMVASGLFVAAAPNYPVLMLGRALLGVAIGGFWAMSTATVMRLVPAARVPAALATLNAGNALANAFVKVIIKVLGCGQFFVS